MEVVGAVANIVALVEVTAKVAVGCLAYINAVRSSAADKLLLEKEINSLLDILDDVKQLLVGPNSAKLSASQKLRNAVLDCYSQLSELEAKVKPKKPLKMAGFIKFRTALKWPFESKEFEKRLQSMERCRNTIFLALQVDQTIAILGIVENQDSATLSTVLSHLPSAEGASFDSHANESDPKCHPGTRTDILQQILSWAEDKQSQTIFSLNWMAGTGKSTISRTVAKTLSDKGRLGASFFFKRGEGDRGHAAKFFTTVVAQMVSKLPMLLKYVKKAIEADPDLVRKALTEQFEKLILEPLLDLQGTFATAPQLVIVIDALDECEPEQDIKTILHHLSRTKAVRSVNLRIFVTCRPELPIRLGFRDMAGDVHRDMVLHDIPRPTIKHDISVFLRHELSKIRDDHNQSLNTTDSLLPPDWPGQLRLDILVDMALPLFIFAATMCRFVGDPRFHPEKRLELVLKYQTAAKTSKFDKTYLPVLDQLLTGLDEDEKGIMLAEFEEVVGSIIILTEPLSTSSLENILGLEKTEVDRRLKMLHSVLSVPSNQNTPVRLLHLSFRDFLIDPVKRGKSPFFLDEMNQHKRIVVRCLELLSRPGILKTNICDLKGPGTLRAEIDSTTIDICLLSEVKYACRHWVYHLEHSGNRIRDGDQVDTFLKNQFIHWLEALGLMGGISEAIPMIASLLNLAMPGESNDVAVFLNDARRFVLRNRQIIDTAPLQVYSSALVFAPEISIVKKQFQDHVPSWIRHQSGLLHDWGDTLQTLDSHTGYIDKILFSSDNKLLAAETKEAVVLWDAETGEPRQKFEHPSSILPYDFAFAWNTDLLAVVYPSSIQVVKPSTGIVLQELFTQKGERFITVLFSPDDKALASVSHHIIRLWDPDVGMLLQTIETSDDLLHNQLCFSRDSCYIAFKLRERKINVWDLRAKRALRTFTEHQQSVRKLAFSYNGDIVSISEDGIKIWNPSTGEILHSFEDHWGSGAMTAFSAHNKLFAYGSQGCIIVRESSNGKLFRTLPTEGGIGTMAFAKNGRLLVVAFGLNNIKVLDLESDGAFHVFEGHKNIITSLAVSSDNKLLGSASMDFTVRLWNLDITRPAEDTDNDPIQSTTLSCDGKLFSASQYDNGLAVFDAHHDLKIYFDGNWVSHMAFSEDNNFLTIWSESNKTISLIDLSSGEGHLLLDLSHLEIRYLGRIPCVFSSNGRGFALSTAPNGSIYMCNLEKKSGQHLSESGTGMPRTFSEDGSLLASSLTKRGSPFEIVAVHDATTGEHIRNVDTRCKGSHVAIAFSKDNKLLVIQNSDCVEVRDLTTGAEVGRIESDKGFWELGVSPGDFLHVETKRGLLNIPPLSATAQPRSELQPLFKLYFQDEWVIRNGERLLWIPQEYCPDEPAHMDFRNNTFLWANSLGLATLVEIECP
ncbi:hypothetical protein AJ78_07735 [Emergomyces pasteurianus Ep9510]|uniref:Nephrocystin 3-like N-terminal domain-containing protein n=1 Tax=Emergomyces pasteurianus Ep9510 TaxID=1447872 RepID=A0A1J9P5V0_9EURO|nr:hypothetical protein AJ78_07735 [Emergomyces pasteurianus Ep9510]